VITVLLVYLFLFQIWGLLSHVAQPRAGDLPGYRVPIPATWIILDRWEGENGESALWGMASQRTCVDPYAPSYLPTVCLSGWDIRSEHFGQASETPIFRRHPTEIPGRWYDEGVIDRREFRVGGETVACQKFRPPSHVDNSSLTYIECSGTGRLRAHIRGPGGPIPAFFEMLSGVSLKQK
jgi:hypothetical protein